MTGTLEATRPTMRGLAGSGIVAGVVAAAGTTVVAAVARAAGADLEVDGSEIPLAAFAWWTVVGAVLGIVLARLLRDRRRFVAVTVGATALSLVPAIAMPDGAATKVVLVVAHLFAAGIVVPVLARRLDVSGRRG